MWVPAHVSRVRQEKLQYQAPRLPQSAHSNALLVFWGQTAARVSCAQKARSRQALGLNHAHLVLLIQIHRLEATY